MSGIMCVLIGSGGLPISVSATSIFAFGFGMSASGPVSSSGQSPDTTVTGGTSPYTYAWTHVSTSSGNTPTISSATAQNPYWDVTATDSVPSTSIWKVTATDATGRIADVSIQVNLEWINIS